MVYRAPRAAPASQIPEERRGRELGRFCKSCGGVFSPLADRHAGKPVYGRDHVASTCSHEGEDFDAGEDWWEPAVEMLPAVE